MASINVSDTPYGSSKKNSTRCSAKQKTETFNGTATELCKLILEKSCEYCKLTCVEMQSEYLFYRYDDKQHAHPIYYDKDKLLDLIFVEFIKKNTNTSSTIIVISSYLNQLKP